MLVTAILTTRSTTNVLQGSKETSNGVKSVNEKDVEGKRTIEKEKAIAEVSKSIHNRVILLGADGQRIDGLRTVTDMEKAVREHFAKLHM